VIIREVVDEVLLIVLSGGCLISNKLFDCGAAPAHDPQPDVFKGIFAIAVNKFCGISLTGGGLSVSG